MSFLCPSVGLLQLKLRRFTRTGLATSRSRGLRSNIRNRGTSVAFERADSDVSIASQGGFSALYGEINSVRPNEERDDTSERCRANCEERFGGIYIGEDSGKPQKTGSNTSSCQHAPDVEYFAQNPATVQSFTFFEETFMSSQHQHQCLDKLMVDEMTNEGAHFEQRTPLLSNSSLPSSSSKAKRAPYNLPNWVRQRRCLPRLDEVDFDMIDAISLGSLSISPSEIDTQDENNNTAIVTTGLENGSKVNSSRAKRTYSEDSSDGVFQIQNPCESHQTGKFPRGGVGDRSTYSPKKTKTSMSTDKLAFQQKPIQENVPFNPPSKLRPAKTVRKSPSTESLRRRLKKRESLLRPKQLNSNLSNARTKTSLKSNKKTLDESNGAVDPKGTTQVGSLVRSKPLYMRATSERALDPCAMKLRLESSMARKWRQNGDRSPLSEVTNVSQPQASICMRMEIVQRPVMRDENHRNKGARKILEPPQGSGKLPAGKLRPTPQRSKSAYSKDLTETNKSFPRRSTEVTEDSSRPISLKEENIDSLFRSSCQSMHDILNSDTDVVELSELTKVVNPNIDSALICDSYHQENPEQAQYQADSSGHIQRPLLVATNLKEIDHQATQLQPISEEENAIGDHMVNAETDDPQPPKHLIHKPTFADNSVKEARIVSTTKMAVSPNPNEVDASLVIPPKMLKSASFTAPSKSNEGNMTSSKSTTRSATNVRALQTPLTQQQRRKVRRRPPGNKNGHGHRVSAVEASREDIIEVVAAMKVSLDSNKIAQEKSNERRETNSVKDALGDAVAVYDCEARHEDDVTVKVSDVVTVLNKDDPDLLFVEKRAGAKEEGFVPKNFLQQKPTSDFHRKASDNNSDMSTVEVDESVDTILEKTELNCQVGNSQSKNVPQQKLATFVPANQILSPCQAMSQSGDISSVEWSDQVSCAEARSLHHHSSSQSKIRKCGRSHAGVPNRKFNTNIRSGTNAVLIETYVVVSDYTEQDEDEVSVVEGEIVVVNSDQQHEMDWMWVYVPRTERFGFVPAFSARPLGFHFSDV
ncbi:uncharacterized protein LOC110973122 [Acanthaster planci]|uniref:Uncharacterized protein LOC110973122 n=1 Tax=Acanthaster planci TaxID=133434 RepID=A0A8B7XGK2_ACAPL|nr:uncharacterized protein LOC110973122 [Acanthaster planci]